MHSIEQLRVLVGLSGEDETRIGHHRVALSRRLADWIPEFESWFREICGWKGDDSGPLLPGYFDSYVQGLYDDSFYAMQYNQALFWLRQGVGSGQSIAVLSRIRQFFVELSESCGERDLARSLCRVVDVAQSILGMVSHLQHTLQRFQQSAEVDMARIQRGCRTFANAFDQDLVQAYSDHYQWKLRAYSLALGEPVDPEEVPMDPHECKLGRWLDRGGFDQVPLECREGLRSAHELLHALMTKVLGEAREGHPHQILPYLMNFEAASEEIARILDQCLETGLHQLAAQDGLTRLGNRRMFEKELERRIAHARRNGYGFGLLFMDLDHFKAVNDTHSHGVGDQVLRHLAGRMANLLRGEDAVYRWGGEEFAALVHAADDEQVGVLADRIREAVAAEPVPTDAGGLEITLSVGATFVTPRGGDDMEPLFRRADEALNQAKREGRNRVVVAGREG